MREIGRRGEREEGEGGKSEERDRVKERGRERMKREREREKDRRGDSQIKGTVRNARVSSPPLIGVRQLASVPGRCCVCDEVSSCLSPHKCNCQPAVGDNR